MKKPKKKEIIISDLIPDMKRDIHKIQKEQSEIKFYGKILDDNLDNFCKSMGVKFTETEQSKFYEIVEYYSPKYANGDIIDYLPFDFAWELYKIQKGYNFDKKRFKNMYFHEEIFEIAKDNDLSLEEADELQDFMKDNDFTDPFEAYEAWNSDN
jgi:hypothetical protein